MLVVAMGVTPARAQKFHINTERLGHQHSASVASLVDGGFVVVWRNSNQSGALRGIFGRIFDSSGNPRGREFQISNPTTISLDFPVVAGLTDGGFVVAWHSTEYDVMKGFTYHVYAQRLSPTGQKIGLERLIESSLASYPSVAALSRGGFVIAWTSVADTQDYDVRAQIFSADGERKGHVFRVNAVKRDMQGGAAVTGLRNGEFVVVWASGRLQGPDNGLYGQRFSAKGQRLSDTFRVNPEDNSSRVPRIAAIRDGFVVAWERPDPDLMRTQIFAQRFGRTGLMAGGPLAITENGFVTRAPSICALSGGGFAVAWVSIADGIFGRRYSSSGRPNGREFRILDRSSDNFVPTATATWGSENGFVTVWSAYQATGYLGIFGRLLDE